MTITVQFAVKQTNHFSNTYISTSSLKTHSTCMEAAADMETFVILGAISGEVLPLHDLFVACQKETLLKHFNTQLFWHVMII